MAYAWDFMPEHLLCILGDVSAAHLLQLARVSTQWRAAAAELLRSRSEEPMQWRQAMASCDEDTQVTASANTAGHNVGPAEHLLRGTISPLVNYAGGWRHLPRLAVVFATDNFCELAGIDHPAHGDATCLVADMTAALLPPSCAVVVVRSTGIVGSTIATCSPLQLHEVENGEEVAGVSVLLAHLPPSVGVEWLGVGENMGKTPRGKKQEWMARSKVMLRGQLAPHAGAWWLSAESRVARHRVSEADASGMDDSQLADLAQQWTIGDDRTHATGRRLLCILTGPADGAYTRRDQLARWAAACLSTLSGRARLASGGVALAAAIRTGTHTEGRQRAAPAAKEKKKGKLAALFDAPAAGGSIGGGGGGGGAGGGGAGGGSSGGGSGGSSGGGSGGSSGGSSGGMVGSLPPSCSTAAASFSFGPAITDAAEPASASSSSALASSSSLTSSLLASSSLASSSSAASNAGGAISVSGLVLSFSSDIQASNCTLSEPVQGPVATRASLRAWLARRNYDDDSVVGGVVGSSFTNEHRHAFGLEDDEDGVLYAGSHSTARSAPMGKPAVAFVFTCNGRGEYMHQEPAVESTVLRSELPGTPFAGFFAGGELGPGFAYDTGEKDNGELQFSCVISAMGSRP